MSDKDLLGGLGGTERPDTRPAKGGFWKPEAPATLIGTLDRIEPGRKFGDFAVVTNAVVFRAGDNKPMYAESELAVPAGANLSGKLRPEDSGKHISIAFTGWEQQTAGKMRRFTVVIGHDSQKTEKLLAAARKKIAAEQPERHDDSEMDAGADGLPF